jgi:vacuolar-type H+-ATPase subunit H
MARTTPPEREDSSVEEINRVLDAERRARERVSRCEQDASRMIEEARACARDIRARTERRIGRMHARVEQRIIAQVMMLAAEAEAIRSQALASDERETTLEAALERLAERLTAGPG